MPLLSAARAGLRCLGVGVRVGVWGAAAGAVAWWLLNRKRDTTALREYAALVGPHFCGDPESAFIELDADRGDPGFDRVEEIGGPEDGAGSDAEEGAQPVRRRVRRKKVVAVPYAGGAVQGAYLVELVAEARLCTQARTYSVANADFIRVFLLRRMTEHGVRPSHIASHIDSMVLAAFHKSSQDRAYEEGLRTQRRAGYQRGAGTFHLP